MVSVKRSDLHHNFLKSIILRLDFQGVFESEMETVIKEVKTYAKNKGFTRYEEKILNHPSISIEIDGQEQPLPTNKISGQMIYTFVNEIKGFVLNVSSSFISLVINSACYTPFEDYCSFISEIATIYEEKIDFFTVVRLGYRKTNECLTYDIFKINEYFSPSYFNFFDDIPDVENLQSNKLDRFNVESCHVNLASNIVQGKYEGKKAYSIKLDTDVYLDSTSDIHRGLKDNALLKKMNDLHFEIFIQSLTEKFIEELSKIDGCEFGGLIGIENNE